MHKTCRTWIAVSKAAMEVRAVVTKETKREGYLQKLHDDKSVMNCSNPVALCPLERQPFTDLSLEPGRM